MTRYRGNTVGAIICILVMIGSVVVAKDGFSGTVAVPVWLWLLLMNLFQVVHVVSSIAGYYDGGDTATNIFTDKYSPRQEPK